MACDCEDPDMAAELVELRTDYAAVRTCIRAILNGAQSYTLDTGPGNNRVVYTRADLSQLRSMRQDILSEIARLEQLCCDCNGPVRVTPGF